MSVTTRFAAAALFLSLACAGDTAGPGAAGQVTVANDFFSPTSVSPDANGLVTWTWNSGGRVHT